MKKVRVAIIGAGNISNTRHIPALNKLKNVEIVGVIGVTQKNIDRTLKKYKIPNSLLVKGGDFKGELANCEWFKSVDAVAIGAPPRDHYVMAEASLLNQKHVLVEKPMTMDAEEADKLIELAAKQKKQLCVMHNFQFTSGIQKLEKIIANGELGELVSFYELQLSNKYRRLPEWYNDLPLGLFFDEAPHFMYMLEKFGGPVKIENTYVHPTANAKDNTPLMLSSSLRAGKYPANIFLNFETPVCEWYFVVAGEKKIAFYDLFKDILIVLPSDNEHYAPDILKNSWRATFQYWAGFIKNGFRMINGNLLYGHEVVMSKYISAVAEGRDVEESINGAAGKRAVVDMLAIVESAK